MSETLALCTIADLSRRLGTKEISPVEVVRSCLERIEALDGKLHSFNALRADEALQEAREAEGALLNGDRKGPLHGLPIGIKDMIDVAGMPTTAQAAHRRNAVAQADAGVVMALRQAGAIIIGKQAMPEYAVGITQFDLPWPPARNPWNLQLNPSGSSSGGAIAVAAGLCPGAVGTETAGSIRDPAAWCGVAGLKPTDGLVSLAGVLPLSRSMDCLGPLAWTAEDCALMLPAMISPDANDRGLGVRLLDPSGLRLDLRGLRIGVPRHYYEEDPHLDPEVLAAAQRSLEVLADLGAVVSTVRLPDFAACAATARSISWPEEYAEHGAELRAHPDRLGLVTRSRLQDGKDVPAHVYINALRRQAQLKAELGDVMREVDLLALPTMTRPAQPLAYETSPEGEIELSLTRPFNLTGSPALSLCNGFSTDGLPLSLQLVGHHYEDHIVLGTGCALETALGTRARRPPLESQH